MSVALSQAICHHHPQREAAARCVSCGRSYCRECVTALDRRMYCAGCFAEKTGVKEKKKRDWFLLTTAVQLVLGVFFIWIAVYGLGKLLASIPSGFHEGSVWEKVTDAD